VDPRRRKLPGCPQAEEAQPKALTEAEKKRIRADFRLFLIIMWRHLGLPDPTPFSFHGVLPSALPRPVHPHGVPWGGQVMDHRSLRPVAAVV
jgi:hypothetical protein